MAIEGFGTDARRAPVLFADGMSGPPDWACAGGWGEIGVSSDRDPVPNCQ